MVGLKEQKRDLQAEAVQTPGAFDRVKIAFVIDSIDSWQAGGTEQQIAKFISALHGAPFEVEIFLLRPSAGLTASDFPCPVHVASSKGPVGGARIKTVMGLARLFRQRRPHIVQTFFRDGTYYGVTAAKLAKVPIIVISRRNLGHWKSFVDRLGLPVINRMADAWQCNSQAVADSLRDQERVPGGRIEILANAIDLERFSPPSAEERAFARERLCLPPAAPVFVSVANLTSVKDPLTLVEAARLVRRSLGEARFILVGEGSLWSRLEERVKQLGLEPNIRLAGAQPDVRPFLAAADVGLLASRSEGSSNALLEYMAMGLPAVVSDIPANRELVSGVFFEPGNPAALAEKILDLWGNAALRARVSQEHLRRAEEFSEEKFALRAQAFYARLAAQHLDRDRQY